MDPVTAMVAMQVAGGVAKGVAGHQSGMADAARQTHQARLADTQALQRDASLRDELTRFISTTTAARAANGLSATSPNALLLMKDARETSNKERRIMSNSDRQKAANLRAGAKASKRAARMSLLTGVIAGGSAYAKSKI